MSADSRITYFGHTNKRQPFQRFGIKAHDRLSHISIIGKTGTGKSTLLETLATQDIIAGNGLAVIDPHGDLAERLARTATAQRADDLIYVDPSDLASPYGYNPLRRVAYDRVPLAASGLLESMKKLWVDAWGVRMEHVLRNTLLALIEYGDAKLPDILRLMTNQGFQREVARNIRNDQVREFWQKEFPAYHPMYRQQSIAPIQNKVGALLADPRLYRFFVTAPEELRFRRFMDEGKILIVNLSKGRLGEDSAHLLGAILMTTMSLAAFSRAELPEELRTSFYLYVDEFQSFTTIEVANMISELRKFGVGLALAHQHLHQLEPAIRHAVLGNAGTIISFRLGAEDAAVFAKEFAPVFAPEDFLTLPNHSIVLKLMIDGMPSKPFSATTLGEM
jgi:energy-coupling factor transporter ATP-binding protein EcfA2